MDTFTSWRAFFCSVLFPKILQAVLIGFSKPLRIDFPTAPPKTTAQQKNSPKSGSLSYSFLAPQKVSTKKSLRLSSAQKAACQQETHQGTLSDAFDQWGFSSSPRWGLMEWSINKWSKKSYPHPPNPPTPQTKKRVPPQKKLVCILYDLEKNNNYPIFSC